MIESSKFGAGTSQRAAGGGIAAGTAELNGLMRAGRKASAEIFKPRNR